MVPRHHTRLLFLVAAVAWALLALTLATAAGAQEGDDPLSRYDSQTTQQMAAEYEADRARAEELEAEIERLEDAGEWGEPRSDLRDELSELPDGTDMANALGDARLSDIESAPLPDAGEDKAVELRRKAQSLDALQSWGDSADIDINSRLYGIIGEGEAAKLAAVYRKEAGAIELAENSEEVAKERAAEEVAPEPEKETEETPGDGGEKPAEQNPEPAPEAALDEGDAGGSLDGLGSAVSGFSLTSLLAAALIAVGVGYYVVGLIREGLGDRLKRVGAPQQARAPKPKSKPGGKTGGKPRSSPDTSKPESSRDGERPPERPERERLEKPSEEPRRDRSAKTEEKDGSALADRLQRMRRQGPAADEVEPPTAEELADMFDREDDDGEGR